MNVRAIHLKFLIAGLFVLASTLVLKKSPAFGDAANTLHAHGVITKVIFERVESRVSGGSFLELPRTSRSNFLTSSFALTNDSIEHGRLSLSASFVDGRLGGPLFLRPLYILLKILII